MIQWVEANIAKYKGNPDRMFAWASRRQRPLGTYVGRPELYGPKGVGLKGVIFMSGQFNILPCNPPAAKVDAAVPTRQRSRTRQHLRSRPNNSTDGALPGAPPDNPVDPTPPARSRTPSRRRDATNALHFARLQGDESKIMLATAELDPGIEGKMSAFNQAFHESSARKAPTLPDNAVRKRRKPHVGSVLHRHPRQNSFRTNPGLDQKIK